MIDAISRNKWSIASTVGAAVLVYKWNSIKPIAVSLIGPKATAFAALVAAVAVLARAVFTGIGLFNGLKWLINRKAELLKKQQKRAENMQLAEPAKRMQDKQKAENILPKIRELEGKITTRLGGGCNDAEKAVLTNMQTKLSETIGNLDCDSVVGAATLTAAALATLSRPVHVDLQPALDGVLDPNLDLSGCLEDFKQFMKGIQGELETALWSIAFEPTISNGKITLLKIT